MFSNTDLQKQQEAVNLEKYKHHKVLQIVQKSSKDSSPDIRFYCKTYYTLLFYIVNSVFLWTDKAPHKFRNPSYTFKKTHPLSVNVYLYGAVFPVQAEKGSVMCRVKICTNIIWTSNLIFLPWF